MMGIFAEQYGFNGLVYCRGGTTPFSSPFSNVSPQSLSLIWPKGMRGTVQ